MGLQEDLAAKLAAQSAAQGITLPNMGANALPGGPANVPPPPPVPPMQQAAPMVVQGQAPPQTNQGDDPFARGAGDLRPRPASPLNLGGIDLGLLPPRHEGGIDLRGVKGPQARVGGDLADRTRIAFDAVKPGGGVASGGGGKPTDFDAETDKALGMSGPKYEAAKDTAADYRINENLREQDQSAHEAEAGAKLASLHEDRAALEHAYGAKLSEIDQHTTDMVEKHQAEAARLAKDAADMAVDPNRRYAGGLGAVRRITDALAMAAGAFGGGLTHSPNTAMQIVNGEIDRDVKQQEEAKKSKEEKAGNARGMVAAARQAGLDAKTGALLQKQAGHAEVDAWLGKALAEADTVDKRDKILQMQSLNNQARATLGEQQAEHWGQVKYALMHPAAKAAGAADEKAVAKLNAETQTAQDAVAHTLSQGEDAPGYGYGARVGRALSGDNGVLTSHEGRESQMETKDLAAQYLRLSGRPLRGSAVDDLAGTVRTPGDKVRLAQKVKSLIEANQAAHVAPSREAGNDAMDAGPEMGR